MVIQPLQTLQRRTILSNSAKIEKACPMCGVKFHTYATTGKKFCSRECGYASRRKTYPKRNCKRCKKEFQVVRTKPRQVFCGRHCAGKFAGMPPAAYVGLRKWEQTDEGKRKMRENMAVLWEREGFAEAVSERMKRDNPSHDPENIAKALRTKKERGITYENLTGGNGKISPMEQRLWEALGEHWSLAHAVTTDQLARAEGCPNHYKLDLALPAIRLAVEADGGTHNSPAAQERDGRKDRNLTRMGWTVLRFKNYEIEHELSKCVQSISETVKRLSTT